MAKNDMAKNDMAKNDMAKNDMAKNDMAKVLSASERKRGALTLRSEPSAEAGGAFMPRPCRIARLPDARANGYKPRSFTIF